MAENQVTVTVKGPLFDGRMKSAVSAYLVAAEDAVADMGVNEVRATLGDSLRNPTGFYQSRIVTDRAQDSALISDSDVVYGPWLEGTSSRNSTTRFKGYASFRRATGRVQAKAAGVAERVLKRFIGRMQ